jgi:hypothetical protein
MDGFPNQLSFVVALTVVLLAFFAYFLLFEKPRR